MTELYPRPNEQKGGKGVVPVANIGFFSRKSSMTGSMPIIDHQPVYRPGWTDLWTDIVSCPSVTKPRGL